MKKKEAGFTLIELSIVIVIIGLIVAGVLGGQELVKQAKIKAMMNQLQSFKTAINAFKLQYDEFPGDITNAYDYWGSDCAQNAGNCNGNGNGHIDFDESGTTNHEGPRAWQHLYLAKIFDKKYTGYTVRGTSGQAYCDLGVSNPKSPFKNAGFQFTNKNFVTKVFGKTTSVLMAGKTTGGLCNQGLFTPKEMFNIDKKYDDGKPRAGIIRASQVGNGCHSTNGENKDKIYTLGSEIKKCNFNYDLGT